MHPFASGPRFAVLGRFLLTRSSGPMALKVGLPLYLGIGIFEAVIFAHSGLDASTVVMRAERTPATRLVLLMAWSIATLPVARSIVSTEANLFLRSLPIPRWQLLGWLGALLFLAELPWFALWTRGGGVAIGWAATLIALALHAGLVARVLTAIDAVLLVVTCTAWLMVHPFSRIAAGALIFIVALARAWRRAPEQRARRPFGRIVGAPALALAKAHALTVIRRHSAALLRAAFIVAIGMAWTGATMLNDEELLGESKTVLRVAMAGWIPSCILGVATPLGPILRTEGAAEWVLAACGTTPAQRRAATLGLLGAAGGTVGLLTGAALAIALGADVTARFALVAGLASSGAALSALTEICFRWASREDGRDGGRLVLALGALLALAEGALWL
jgi:hypothetical protein